MSSLFCTYSTPMKGFGFVPMCTFVSTPEVPGGIPRNSWIKASRDAQLIMKLVVFLYYVVSFFLPKK